MIRTTHRMRTHPTQGLGVMSEINTIHAFGKNGQETAGWPYGNPTTVPGVAVGPGVVYTNPRMSQNEMGGSPSVKFQSRKGRGKKKR